MYFGWVVLIFLAEVVVYKVVNDISFVTLHFKTNLEYDASVKRMGLLASTFGKVFANITIRHNYDVSVDLTLCMATVTDLSSSFVYIGCGVLCICLFFLTLFAEKILSIREDIYFWFYATNDQE